MNPLATTRRPRARTRTLLLCGAAAGPLYIVSGLVQAFTRDGFDLTRHPVSILSNGSLGWIQIATFLTAGVLTIAGAGALPSRLLMMFGAGLVGAGLFVADPMDGFPVGTPAGPPQEVSWHGTLHFMTGGIGFIGLIAACVVYGRRYARAGRRGRAAYSIGTGVVFTAAFAGIASGSSNPAVIVSFGVAIVLGWAWLTALFLDTAS